MKDRSYTDLLEIVKQAVSPTNIRVDITDLSRTRDGELLLKVENGFDKVEELRKAIKKTIPNATTTLSLDKVVVHMQELSSLTPCQLESIVTDLAP